MNEFTRKQIEKAKEKIPFSVAMRQKKRLINEIENYDSGDKETIWEISRLLYFFVGFGKGSKTGLQTGEMINEKRHAKDNGVQYTPSGDHPNTPQTQTSFLFIHRDIFLVDTPESDLAFYNFYCYCNLIIETTSEQGKILSGFSKKDKSGTYTLDPIERYQFLIDNNKMMLFGPRGKLTKFPIDYYNKEHKKYLQNKKVL